MRLNSSETTHWPCFFEVTKASLKVYHITVTDVRWLGLVVRIKGTRYIKWIDAKFQLS